MAVRFDTITFLSDYGTRDEFVGVVKSVIREIAPHVTVVDLSHEIPAYDVRAGSLTLSRAAQYLCRGVVLAVVDPGVGRGGGRSPSRSATGRATSSARTTGCSPEPSR